MRDKYLIINAGSSSLKFTLYNKNEEILMKGNFEKIGNPDSFWTITIKDKKIKDKSYLQEHDEAIKVLLSIMYENNVVNSKDEIIGVGHRVLHGGEIYKKATIINEEVLSNIKSLIKLGPLHLPGEIMGINAMLKNLPNAINVAVFDTSFHQTMDKVNYMYPIPYKWYQENGVRKYGFHGISHKYITEYMKDYLHKEDINLIICHIGSGASLSLIENGKSINTTMGLTPLDGLMMGTRSGSIDASIIEYIMKERHETIEEVSNDLNKHSGLLGICGKNDYRDVRELLENGNKEAKLAYDMFCQSIINNIGKYYFQIEGNLSAIVFTAGIGENAIDLRKDIINKISKVTGIELDEKSNQEIASFKDKKEGVITTPNSSIPVLVVPTNEEVMILREMREILINEK